MKKIVFIKLGGSLITDKKTPYTKRADRIQKVSREIASLWKQKKYTLIVGNGAGSFGHYEAKRYETSKGFVHKESKKGFSLVHKQAAYLNKEVVDTLLSYDIPAISIAPSSFCVSNKGTISYMCIQPLIQLIMNGMLPVLYGDVVVDEKKGCAIISTDYLFFTLADKLVRHYPVYCVVHMGVTDGIYLSNGETIPLITPKMYIKLKKEVKGSHGIDVTGGMYEKLKWSIQLVKKHNIPSYIINGIKENQLSLLMIKNINNGTKISYNA